MVVFVEHPRTKETPRYHQSCWRYGNRSGSRPAPHPGLVVPTEVGCPCKDDFQGSLCKTARVLGIRAGRAPPNRWADRMAGERAPQHSRTKQRRPEPRGGQQNCRPSMQGEQWNRSGTTQMPSPPGPAVQLNPGQQFRSIPPHLSPNRAQNRD